MTSNNRTDSARQVIERGLSHDEKILWLGQPKQGLSFTTYDILFIPFSLLWCGFAFFWEINVLNIGGDVPSPITIVFPIFGIPFILLGLYMVFGRFIYKAWKKRFTFYAITSKRAISLQLRNSNERSREIYLPSLSDISKNIKNNKTGSIIFESSNGGLFSYYNNLYANTGMDFWGRSSSGFAFYDLENAEQVYQAIQQVKLSTNK